VIVLCRYALEGKSCPAVKKVDSLSCKEPADLIKDEL
jgi:hypothetical protein